MNRVPIHRLDGLEPDNLLGFLALLGLLRAIENSRPKWRPRARWTVDEPPTRPALHLREAVTPEQVAEGAAQGIRNLAEAHVFPEKDLSLLPDDARTLLQSAAECGGYRSALWAALVSDKASPRHRDIVERTPFCLMSGPGHQHFLERLSQVPRTPAPKPEGRGKSRRSVSEVECLRNALFHPWQRRDLTASFRWDPTEDRRYAYRATEPSSDKPRTEHGANRLASVGLASLTVVPRRVGLITRLGVRGGARTRRGFTFEWPIWLDPVSRAGIEAMLSHPALDNPGTAASLGVVEVQRAVRISVADRYLNFTRASRLPPAQRRD